MNGPLQDQSDKGLLNRFSTGVRSWADSIVDALSQAVPFGADEKLPEDAMRFAVRPDIANDCEMERLGFKPEEFRDTFIELSAYWAKLLPGEMKGMGSARTVGQDYLNETVSALSDRAYSPAEWLAHGKKLGEITARTYRFGSLDFVAALPALQAITSDFPALVSAADQLAARILELGHGEHHFRAAAEMMRAGRITHAADFDRLENVAVPIPGHPVLGLRAK